MQFKFRAPTVHLFAGVRIAGMCYKKSCCCVVLTLTRIIKFVVTGQAPVTLELGNTPGKKHKPKEIHAYITAGAIHAPTRNI